MGERQADDAMDRADGPLLAEQLGRGSMRPAGVECQRRNGCGAERTCQIPSRQWWGKFRLEGRIGRQGQPCCIGYYRLSLLERPTRFD